MFDGLIDRLKIALDENHYNPQLFNRVNRVVRAKQIIPESEAIAFEALIARIEKEAEENINLESILGDIPDEFMDPLMSTLMTDPVILPSSKMTVDKAVIQRQLLNLSHDPFDRSELTIDMVKPNTELKAKITAFIEEKRAEHNQKLGTFVCALVNKLIYHILQLFRMYPMSFWST